MRCLTVSQIKRNARGKQSPKLQPAPRAGSAIGRIYDMLMSNKGQPVELETTPAMGGIMRQLRDHYGLDIRQTQRGSKKRNLTSQYTLVGEWFGKVYVDYLADNMEK